MPRGRPLLRQHLAAGPRLPHRPDVAPPPCASLPPFWAEHPRLHPPTHPLHPPETEFGPHHGQWSPPRLAPRVPGHAPALSLPHLETIAGCVRDTDTRAQASGFRGGRPGSGDSAGRPLRRICPPLSPAREERQEAQGPKAKSPGRGCPLPHPQSKRPHGGPGPSKPHPPGSRCKETRHRGICFLGQPAPSAPPASPRRGRCDPAPARGPEKAGECGGGAGHTKGPCGAAQRLPPGTHTTGEARHLAVLVFWLRGGAACPVAWGRAHTPGLQSPLALGPLQASPGPPSPSGDERGTH